MSSLTKQQQSSRANTVINHLSKQMPNTRPALIDLLAIAKLSQRHETLPWEYPWAEVVRWCRNQRRA